MAADNILESNVILKSKITGPEGRGVKNLKDFLDKLDKQLKEIAGQEYKIKFVVDTNLKAANVQGAAKTAGQQAGQAFNQGLNQAIQAGANDVKVKVTETINAKGEVSGSRKATQTNASGTTAKTTTQTVTSGGSITSTTENVNLVEQERQKIRMQQARDAARAQVAAELGLVSPADQRSRARAAANERGRQDAASRIAGLKESGYKETGSRESFDPRTGESQMISTLQKVTRTGLGEWVVVEQKVNRTTGEVNKELFTQAAAARKVGDSFQKATEKVAIWLSATGAVFATVRGFEEAVRVTLELEEATTLLARVGKNLGAEGPAEVRSAVLKMSTVTGGNPEEAMRAAAVFARAGQNTKEVIDSVRASMIAARIAELDVVEAAELLSAAYLQFGMNASEIMPTLDQLNTLSNNYRVTTDDLLQSISRAGSVIAQQGGRLSELAAITAVTSQVTARSGAEIGNAVKTIASNLERVETRGLLFDKLAVQTVDAEGKTKSYSQTLMELQVAMNQVSESERNQIGISIAGVRQRNILLAQLQNVSQILKAENIAVFQPGDAGGSSMSELKETAGTLASYLARLRAEAISLAVDGGGPLADMAKDVVSVMFSTL